MPIHASSSDYLGWNAQQLVHEITRLKTEIDRLNGDKVRLATQYGNVVADHKTEINRLQGLVNSNVDQYARNNEDLTRENDRLRKLVESQCIHNGHDVETIFYVGNPDPVSLTCRTCGRSWGVTAHD